MTRDCQTLAAHEVERVLVVELGTEVQTSGIISLLRVEVDCDGDAAHLSVTDPVTGKLLKRTIRLDDPSLGTRSRLLGVAIVELIMASWAELSTNPTPQVEPVKPPVPEPIVRVARSAVDRRTRAKPLGPSSFRLGPIVSQRSFFSAAPSFWGGGFEVGQDPLPSIGWSLDALVEVAGEDQPLGMIRLSTFTLGASLFLYHRFGWLVVEGGGGLRAGAFYAEGRPRASAVRSGSGVVPWGWPLARARVRLEPIEPVYLTVGGELGYVVLPATVTVSGQEEIPVRGPWRSVVMSGGVTW